MSELRRYRQRPQFSVTAVPLQLDTDGLTYHKWGGRQQAKSGDWLVCNEGDVYTVDAASFAATYTRLSPGVYIKSAPVWARQAGQDGKVRTKEGYTEYQAGDYLVANDAIGEDAYAVPRERFERHYQLDDQA